MALESGGVRSAASRLGVVLVRERGAASGHTYGAAAHARRLSSLVASSKGRIPGLRSAEERGHSLGFLCQVNEVRGLLDVTPASLTDPKDLMLWRGMAYDAQGKPLMVFDGNGIGTKNRYHPTRGFVESSRTYRWTNNQPIQDLDLNMDDLGNVSWRRLTAYVSDGSTAPLTEPEVKTEAFNFDNLNRLTQCYVANQREQSMACCCGRPPQFPYFVFVPWPWPWPTRLSSFKSNFQAAM